MDNELRHRRRIQPIWIVGLLFLATQSSAAESKLDLASYLVEVRDRNPVIQSARARAAALEHRERPARSWDDPFVAIGPDGYSEGHSGAGMVRYQISQAIPFPGKPGARGDAASERARSADADVETIERQLVVAATQTFYRLLHAQRARELNRELTDLIADAEASGKARYRTGDATHHQWLLAKAELGVLATERVRLEGDTIGLRAEINELRNRPFDAPLGTLIADLPVASLFAEAPSPRDSSESRSLGALVRAADADRRSARLAPLPDLVVQAMMEDPRRDMEEERSWGVMFGITIPLYWPAKQRELFAAAERERDAAVAEKEALDNRLAAELARARAELATATGVLELYERDVVPATEMALESARSGYVVGRVTLGDLVFVARARREQSLEYLAARIDVVLARLRIVELLSTPRPLRLAPETPTLFGTGMGGSMRTGGNRAGMAGPTAISVGSGMGLGAARGSAGQGDGAEADPAMRGM